MDMTRRGWIQGIVSSVASAAIVLRATPAETALVKVGAPADLLVSPPTPVVPAAPGPFGDFLPTLYVKTIDGSFEPFAMATEMNMLRPRVNVESWGDGSRQYVQGLPDITGSFVVIGQVQPWWEADGRMGWKKR